MLALIEGIGSAEDSVLEVESSIGIPLEGERVSGEEATASEETEVSIGTMTEVVRRVFIKKIM